MIIQIKVNLPKILVWPKKTLQHVSAPSLNVFGPMKTELWAKEVGEFSVMLCAIGKSAGEHSFASAI